MIKFLLHMTYTNFSGAIMECECGEDLTEFRSFPDTKLVDGGTFPSTPNNPGGHWTAWEITCPNCGKEHDHTDSSV